jgi:hypothetical protein
VADTKTTVLPAATVVNAADLFYFSQSAVSKGASASLIRQYVGAGLSAGSVASVSAGYAADTYLAGSAITVPTAGMWKVATLCNWTFDMTKTAAGTAAPAIIVRMGTLGTTGDAAIATLTWAAGTAAADSGTFSVNVNFRTVGSGTSAVIQAMGQLTHQLTTTGLSNNTTNFSQILATSAGFNSTTQTIIGLSFNGGASFSGTNTLVQAYALNV